MAKGSSSRRSATTSPTSLAQLLSPAALPLGVTIPLETIYDAPTLDLRKYHPQPSYARTAPAIKSTANATVVGPKLANLSIAIPNRVGICVRRKSRREVLFALNRQSRRGRGSGRKRHRNQYTKVHC